MKARNLLRIGASTLRANLFGTARPLNVMISVTNRCPARCSYCNIPNRRQREMTTAELIGLFDELRAFGTQRVALWGGEPLVRDDIGELVDYASRRCGFFVSVDTNGYLVPRKLEALRNLDVLVVSFDGPREVHDRNREPGSFDKAVEALRVACRTHRVLTITVLTKENLASIDYVLQEAVRLGFAASFQLPHHSASLASEQERSLQADDERYRDAIRLLLQRKKQGFPIVSSGAYLRHLLRWPDFRVHTSSHPTRLRCRAGQLYCNVDTDGSVYPCSCLVDAMPAKNFLVTGFRQAFAALREVPCKSCIASCFTEYNYIHALHPGVIWNWARYTRKVRPRPGGESGRGRG